MLEPGSLAIEVARTAIGEAQAAAQRVQQLTQGRTQACEGLVAALQRWPSFAVADPWAIEAPMAASSPSPESQAIEERAPPWRDAPRQHVGRSTPAVFTAATSRPQPVMQSPRPDSSRPLTALAPSTVAREEVDALAAFAMSTAASTTFVAAASHAATLAALVSQAIARHAPQALADVAAANLPWSALIPSEPGDSPQVQPPLRLRQATPGASPAALQALDLPTRAAIADVDRADAHPTLPSPFAPAAEMLRHLLSEASPAHPTATPAAPPPARAAAPRAPSRLLSPTDASSAASTPAARPATLAHTPPDEDEEAGADAISRLLANQAWLRGADFT